MNVSTLLLCLLIFVAVILLVPIGPLCYWIHHRIRRDRALAQMGIKRDDFPVFVDAIIMYLIVIIRWEKYFDYSGINSIGSWIEEAKEFQAEVELEELKRRTCPGKLPKKPVWKCSCSRINLPYTDTCVCGMSKQQVPMEIRENISEEDAYWRCLCGRVNAAYAPICTCGREKHQVPAAVRTPSIKTAGKWHCTCGRENPNYTSTCVCGKNKRELRI
ncbi:MAG: hypothetical protein J6J43_02840 [Oscillospiraceae bacterium]|nr:hypothetical protein [Oscillospiraceae bacterium]